MQFILRLQVCTTVYIISLQNVQYLFPILIIMSRPEFGEEKHENAAAGSKRTAKILRPT